MTDLPQDVRVSIVQLDGHTRVRVSGELDLDTAPDLDQRLEALIAESTGDLDLDLSEVTFLGSSGLVVLLRARQALHEDHRRLRVLNPSPPVLRVFDLSGVLEVLLDEPQDDSRRAAQG